ncbi:MAG: hypothetical protein HY367_03215 [Candidatus Aenigmarchaeota archaeon]|nr:hypothetical protein [Candidatus Aenigmarchaeota archaeon]
MAQNRHVGGGTNLGLLLAMIVILVIVVSLAIAYLPGAVQNAGITHVADDSARRSAEQNLLATDRKIALVAPKATRWGPGESGTFSLSIANKGPAEKAYYVSAYAESHPEGSPAEGWISVQSPVIVPPESVKTSVLAVNTQGSVPGTYTFRLLVCETEKCTRLNDPGVFVYDTVQFSIAIA